MNNAAEKDSISRLQPESGHYEITLLVCLSEKEHREETGQISVNLPEIILIWEHTSVFLK